MTGTAPDTGNKKVNKAAPPFEVLTACKPYTLKPRMSDRQCQRWWAPLVGTFGASPLHGWPYFKVLKERCKGFSVAEGKRLPSPPSQACFIHLLSFCSGREGTCWGRSSLRLFERGLWSNITCRDSPCLQVEIELELQQVFLIFQSRKRGFLESLLLHFSE